MSSVGEEQPTQTLRFTNVVSYALLIAVNVASNSGMLGPTNAEISQKYSTPLTPAGYVCTEPIVEHALGSNKPVFATAGPSRYGV